MSLLKRQAWAWLLVAGVLACQPAMATADAAAQETSAGVSNDGGPPGGNPLDAAAGDVVASALSLIGTPYVYGGSDPEGGLDCSGLVGYVYNMAGYTVTLPRSSQEIFNLNLPNVTQKDLQAGDLLFFRIGKGRHLHINHVAIYVGSGRFVHAPNSRSAVRMDHLSDAYWQRYFAGARRVLSSLK